MKQEIEKLIEEIKLIENMYLSKKEVLIRLNKILKNK